MRISHILGLNARTQLFLRYNKPKAKKYANSKLATKRVLHKAGVPVPEIYAKFIEPENVTNFDWEKLPDSFALKPNKGLGGSGIIVVKKRALSEDKKKDKKAWITTQRKKVTAEDLTLHVLDILEGAFSLGNTPDVAYIEEYVGRHKALRKYSYRGTPDIRVIIFNKVPVMAMLRLPTKESGGRANLHQGAIAVGVDITTGITTRAYWHGKYIRYKPATKRKLNGLKIPQFTRILETAVSAGEVTGLGYFGADVVLHPEKGPMILELNYQPGLSIQLANSSGLRKRLERIEDLEIKDSEHGVRIARVLFAERFADRVKVEEGVKTLRATERVKIYPPGKKAKFVDARIDSGALRSSIDKNLAEDLGLLTEENILWRKRYAYRSASGRQSRPVIALTMRLAGRKIKTSASVADRSKMAAPMLIGRNDLQGFLVNPNLDE
jgi:alpha-L-glutamate ligase-like protein